MRAVIKGLSPADYRRHSLQQPRACDWPETNCYVDLWIEVLGGRRVMNPVAGLSFTVAQDFEGDPVHVLQVLRVADLGEPRTAQWCRSSRSTTISSSTARADRSRTPAARRGRWLLPARHQGRLLSHRAHQDDHRHQQHRRRRAHASIISTTPAYFALEGADFDGLFRRLPEQHGVADALFPALSSVKIRSRSGAGHATRERAPAHAPARQGYARAQSGPRLSSRPSRACSAVSRRSRRPFSTSNVQHLAPARRQPRASVEPPRMARRQWPCLARSRHRDDAHHQQDGQVDAVPARSLGRPGKTSRRLRRAVRSYGRGLRTPPRLT